MSIDTQPYQEALAPPLTDYTEWETSALKLHVREMIAESEFASMRKHAELERQIGHACFELVERARAYDRFVETIGIRPETSQPSEGAAC